MVCGRQDKARTACTVCATAQPESFVSCCRRGEGCQGSSSGAGGWKAGFTAQTQGVQLPAVKRQPERTEVRSSTTRKVWRSSPGHHGSNTLVLSGAQGVGHHCNPVLHPWGSASQGNGRVTQLGSLTHPSSQSLLRPHRHQYHESH